ncbi:MAG: putative boron transporter [Monoraphidium minutum]|nr:MAG: putative boron transporter [Monoraphidium minutum]
MVFTGSAVAEALRPGAGIARDVRARLPCYGADWRDGVRAGARILAPSTFIFLASALPAIAFGQQLADDTDGTLNLVHVLISTAISGLVQAIVGGQPLLIIGVAEPIVLIYGFMYAFAAGQPRLGAGLFLPWAAWVCAWTAALVLLLALGNACAMIDKFTRFSGELFGMLIAVLFFQVGVKGVIHEFDASPANAAAGSLAATTNGLWALLLASGLLLTAAASRRARRWRFLRGWARGALADYGCPLAFVAWTALSFALRGVPGAPRRVQTPNTWQLPADSFLVTTRMGLVPPEFIAAALVPALVIAVLFFFDHNVSSQMAQQKEFNLARPPAYHYDMALLAGLTLLCGLLGLPPVNGVLPQAPMHTRALATLKAQSNKAAMKKAASKAALAEADQAASGAAAGGAKDGAAGGGSEQLLVDGRGEGEVLPVEVNEQRVSGLLQSLLVAACLALTPAIKLVPTAVLWGYFWFMALESLPGSQFWERLLLLATDPKRRHVILEADHAAYLQLVPFRAVAGFTALQAALLAGVWALTTFGGVASFLFPLPIMALVPLRQYVLPRIFSRVDLQQLDAAEYEEAPALPHAAALADAAAGGLEAAGPPGGGGEGDAAEAAAELLDSRMHRFQIAHRVGADEMRRRQRLARQGQLLDGALPVQAPAAAAAAGEAPLQDGGAGALWRRHSHEV